MENTEDIITKRGIVIFLESKKGSKSEEIYPFLYESAGVCTRIMMKGDNPFENKCLRLYDGVPVIVHGTKGRSDILIVSSIEKISNEN